MEGVLRLLPDRLSAIITQWIKKNRMNIQEIRLRVNQPVEINDGIKASWLPGSTFTEADATLFLNKVSEFSLYRLEEELRQGFITIAGGHRIGISGSVVVENQRVKAIHHISSFNIRIAKKREGVVSEYIPDRKSVV